MAKYLVETIAVINRNPIGSKIELTKSSAEKLSAKGYVKILDEVKPKVAPVKKASAPKKSESKAGEIKKKAPVKKASTKK